MSHENIMRLFNDCVSGGKVRPKVKIITKTANYTVTKDDFGSVFVTRGAGGAVTFTLPTASTEYAGEWCLFFNAADQNMFVAGSDEDLTVFNDLTADNIGFATASEKIGGAILAICDGTQWDCLAIGTESQTVNISSAASSSPSASASSSPSSSPSSSVSSSPSSSPSAT